MSDCSDKIKIVLEGFENQWTNASFTCQHANWELGFNQDLLKKSKAICDSVYAVVCILPRIDLNSCVSTLKYTQVNTSYDSSEHKSCRVYQRCNTQFQANFKQL